MKSYDLLEKCINNKLSNDLNESVDDVFIFKSEHKNKPYIISNIKDIKKYYSKTKENIYQYVDYNKSLRINFNIILRNDLDDFDELLKYNINKLKFNINDLIIYQETNEKYCIIHKYYYVSNIEELNIYLINHNLINVKITTEKFQNTLLNNNILVNVKYNLEDILLNNVKNLLKKTNDLNINRIEKEDKYVDNLCFDISKTIFIKAPMGCGKSTCVVKYIKDNNISSFLIISCRKTLTYSICEKLKENNIEIDNYINLKKEKINLSKKLIISPDSIYKLDYPLKKFDLIWIDEGTSFVSYLGTYLFINDKINNNTIIIIEWLLKNCNKLLVTDADLDNKIINYYLCYRKINISLLINCNIIKNNNKYILYNNKENILNNIKSDLLKKNKLYICSDSLSNSKKINEYIIKLNIIKEDNILLYNSESDKKYEKEMYDVNNFWKKYDIVIVSPKVIFGVDFTLLHFDYIYGFYNCNIITVRECIQQMGRIRNLKKNEIHIYTENSFKKQIEYNLINIKYNLIYNITNDIFYKKDMYNIKNLIHILEFDIDINGYKNININNGLNNLILYSLYEKNINLNNFIEILEKKLL